MTLTWAWTHSDSKGMAAGSQRSWEILAKERSHPLVDGSIVLLELYHFVLAAVTISTKNRWTRRSTESSG